MLFAAAASDANSADTYRAKRYAEARVCIQHCQLENVATLMLRIHDVLQAESWKCMKQICAQQLAYSFQHQNAERLARALIEFSCYQSSLYKTKT